MKPNFPPCVYAETLLELPNLSASDVHVSEQYLPMIAEYYKQRLLMSQKAFTSHSDQITSATFEAIPIWGKGAR